jgi:diaminohydroxyphosphoribosylaminopyrimidine deaminase/5-amino-6-(5-phosphoribosylamino)uracil reductase
LCDSSGDRKVGIEEGNFFVLTLKQNQGFFMEKIDEIWMKQTLELANKVDEHAIGINPKVGAIYVKDGVAIAMGYHHGVGTLHAEYDALEHHAVDVSGCTVYVNLEPCAHDDLYPACATLLIEKKVARVVIGSLDPNPIENGDGVKRLLAAGILVETGVCEQDNRMLNEPYFKRFL